MAYKIDDAIVRDASTTHNVTTNARLRAVGVSPSSIDRRRGTLLHEFAKGVYLIGEPNRSALLYATLASVPAGAAGRFTAASLLGLPTPARHEISVVVPNGVHRSLPQPIRLRQTRLLEPEDVCLAGLMRATTVERTICDLAAVLPSSAVQDLIEWGITNRRMTRSSFQACASSYCRQGRTGSTLLGELRIALLDDEPFPMSVLERRGVELFRRNGLGPFVLQFVPPWSDGVFGIVDLAWPELRVIVELDGRRWHMMTTAAVEDHSRDLTANEHGWFVARFGWQEIIERPQPVVRRLRRLLDSRREALAA